MGSNNKDDEDDDDKDSKGLKGTDSPDEDIMSKSTEKPGKMPDLNGDFPPTAEEAARLPKDKELTPEEAARKMADKSRNIYSIYNITRL